MNAVPFILQSAHRIVDSHSIGDQISSPETGVGVTCVECLIRVKEIVFDGLLAETCCHMATACHRSIQSVTEMVRVQDSTLPDDDDDDDDESRRERESRLFKEIFTCPSCQRSLMRPSMELCLHQPIPCFRQQGRYEPKASHRRGHAFRFQ